MSQGGGSAIGFHDGPAKVDDDSKITHPWSIKVFPIKVDLI